MKFKSVSYLDFMTISSASLNLEDRGLTTVSGENRVNPSSESNGAGKTSIAEGICWCLWGKTARGVTGDEIIRNGTKEATVSLTIEEDGGVYTISRNRVKGKGKTRIIFTKGDLSSDLTGGTEAITQGVIQKIVGCNYEVFRAAVYMAQEEMTCLPKASDRELKELVEEAAGLTKLAEAFEIAKEAHREAASIVLAESKLHETLKAILEKAESNLKCAQAEYDHLCEEAEEEERLFKIEREELITRLEELKKRRDDIEEKTPLEKLKKANLVIDGKIGGIREENEKLKEWGAELSHLESERYILMKDTETQESLIRADEKSLLRVNDRIGKPCGECGTIVTKDHLLAVTESILASIADKKDKVKKNADKIAVIDAKIVSHKAKEPKGTPVADLLEKRRKISDAILSRQEMEGRITLMETSLTKSFVKRKPRSIDREKKAVKEASDSLAAFEKKLERVIKEEQDAKKVKDVFDVGGVRAEILDQVTPFLNEKTAEYLAVLTDGTITVEWTTLVRKKDGSLKEKFAVEVTNTENGKGFKSCSGGEKRRISLACSFALQDLVSSRATKPINLLVADEIDDALDVPGLERLMSVMQEKAKDRGTVLVISHNDLKSWIGNSVTVVKEVGGSTVIDE